MDLWKQPSKGRQLKHKQSLQLSQKARVQTTTSDQSQELAKHVTDPIKSIANVLNNHSRYIHAKKKAQQLDEQAKNKLADLKASKATESSSAQPTQKSTSSFEESILPVSCSHSTNQVDQGNSYLYAYNDFVTSTVRALDKDSKLACSIRGGAQGKEIGENSSEIHNNPHNHIQVSTSREPNNEHNESLIDSDEDDVLSYILEQSHPKHDIQHSIKSNDSYNHKASNQARLHQSLQSYEDNLHEFKAHRIEHHLSCSRNSHPRHICGIGGSHNDKLNNIAARLKEGSRQAFLLNQRPSCNQQINVGSSDEISILQSHQFTHDLTVLNNQLANSSKSANLSQQQQYLHSNSESSFLNSDLHSGFAIKDVIAYDKKTLLLESQGSRQKGLPGQIVNDSDSSNQSVRQAPLTQANLRSSNRARQINFGYLNWLLCCCYNLLGASIKQQGGQVNLAHESIKSRKGHFKRARNSHANESSVVSMYSNSQQVSGVGQLGGQAGAYYATQTPQSGAMHQSYTNHAHHHHYPISSDSSLGSSDFANSASRMRAFFRSCCSKKCLIVSCLVLIIFIFIIVIGLSAYLSFLINLNKTNLVPLSGRLKVETQGDSFIEQYLNRTSKEFLAKQQQYETILRGAFDRTQNMLKSYPDHLVKCEVYSFRPGSLWVYFRLFINKRTLLHDSMLMKRRSPDEHVDKQFLPRLTQQTLHSGFEQMVLAFNRDSLERTSRSAQRSESRILPGARNLVFPSQAAVQRDNLRSFDDQINRLMPIIESIDLQSIQITQEFDMLQPTSSNLALRQQSISDNLRASQFLTTPSAVMVATGVSKSTAEYDVHPSANESSTSFSTQLPPNLQKTTQRTTTETEVPSPGRGETVDTVSRKFTLYAYKENTTRPSTTGKPTSVSQREQQDSLFLVNHQQRKPAPTINNLSGLPRINLEGWNSSISLGHSNNSLGHNGIGVGETAAVRPTAEHQPNDLRERERVVKLVSGQPVVSQNNQLRAFGVPFGGTEENGSLNKSLALFAPILKLDQIQPLNSSSQSNPLFSEKFKENLSNYKVSNESVIQMIAPYQKVELSSRIPIFASSQNGSPIQEASIQDLWKDAVVVAKNSSSRLPAERLNPPKRMITINAIGENGDQKSNSSDWTKIAVLSSDISNTIRAQMNETLPKIVAPITSNSNGLPSASHKPKVAPHLKQGGSLITTSAKLPEADSAILLNKDLSNGNQNESQLQATNQSLSLRPKSLKADKPIRRPQTAKPTTNPFSLTNSESSSIMSPVSESQKQRIVKPVIKNQKLKKGPEIVQLQNGNSTTNVTSISSKGIKIVDIFLANLDSNKTQKASNQSLRIQNRTKTLEPFNYNADRIADTLPTTIELTRSVTVPLPQRSAPASNGVEKEIPGLDYTTTSPSINKSTTPTIVANNGINKLGVPGTIDYNNQFKPVTQFTPLSDNSAHSGEPQSALNNAPNGKPATLTTNFSNQWKPITLNNANVSLVDDLIQKSKTTTKSPSISIIVASERLSPPLGPPSYQGSRSPFAMAPSLLDRQAKPLSSGSSSVTNQLTRVSSHRITNSYRVVSSASGPNDFESRRVSRMRQDIGNAGFFTPAEPLTTTASSLTLDTNTRYLGEPILSTEMGDSAIIRGTTNLPIADLVTLKRIDPLIQAKSMSSGDPPKRTRGPFAFETLKANVLSTFQGSSLEKPSELGDVFPGRSGRSPNRQQAAHDRLLVRKKLFLGDDDEITASSTINPSAGSNRAGFNGDTVSVEASQVDSESLKGLPTSLFGDRRSNEVRQQPSNQDNQNDANLSSRCQYYGCNAKISLKFICLNATQICDDFIDCHDESDELDCVSLLRYDSKLNRLSSSNGGGILYLNRRGSLAPMCIDYHSEPINRLGNYHGHEMDPVHFESMKKHQEIIKQINTIGQYACSLQSFSHLVSVKINHHDSVDSLNQIRNSKTYHRLSLIGGSVERDMTLDRSSGVYRPSFSKYEVEITSSAECPSQRTVFVKCGGFECGQDSLAIMEKDQSARSKEGVVANDFPWLVKLYWMGQLSCHGYLIDELWLISSSRCFVNHSTVFNNENGWTAEISHEHYGNDDYQTIESNKRNIKEILLRPVSASVANDSMESSIVLAKLEKPVRFSPSSRPICLPPPAANGTLETIGSNNHCVTVALPKVGSSRQDLLLSKVSLHHPRDCLKNDSSGTFENLICVTEELARRESGQIKVNDATRVLVCSTTQASRSRSKWTVVGFQNAQRNSALAGSAQLFTTVSSQMDWIMDTMNPTTSHPDLGPTANSLLDNGLDAQNQTCNHFKCSSGECLSWSRICDGLYDCSSHDDEKDCHR